VTGKETSAEGVVVVVLLLLLLQKERTEAEGATRCSWRPSTG
jgi:hypothetical protein